MTDSTPTADDYAAIDRAADELVRRGWRRRFSINEVINGWSSFVRSVEDGYAWTIDEFTNDASFRRWAEEARPLLKPALREAMDERLKPLDDRFGPRRFPPRDHCLAPVTSTGGRRACRSVS